MFYSANLALKIADGPSMGHPPRSESYEASKQTFLNSQQTNPLGPGKPEPRGTMGGVKGGALPREPSRPGQRRCPSFETAIGQVS
jgi:hypothetical protein